MKCEDSRRGVDFTEITNENQFFRPMVSHVIQLNVYMINDTQKNVDVGKEKGYIAASH